MEILNNFSRLRAEDARRRNASLQIEAAFFSVIWLLRLLSKLAPATHAEASSSPAAIRQT